jgi:hypothetical protein
MASIRVVRYPGTPTILDPVSGATENATRIPDLVNALRRVPSETGPLYVVVAEDAPWCSSFYPNVLVTANVDGAIESMRKYGRIKARSALAPMMRTHFQTRTLPRTFAFAPLQTRCVPISKDAHSPTETRPRTVLCRQDGTRFRWTPKIGRISAALAG